jgi:phospholipase C
MLRPIPRAWGGNAVIQYALPGEEVVVIDRKRARQLFSWPINVQTNELPEQTVAWWLSESLRRDNISDTTITVAPQGDDIAVSLIGLSAAKYAIRIRKFLELGDKAHAGVVKLKEAKKWHDEWRFLLPLGLPMVNYRSVQLLHFPPIAVLTAYADYLKVPTTVRWSEMLARNGASKDTDIYQAIADIAPVAMPEVGGNQMDSIPHVYDVTFKDYIDALLEFWAGGETRARPMVAFGGTVRNYISNRYLGGKEFPVLGYKKIKLDSGAEIPTLAANHPSRFYLAVSSMLKSPQDLDDPEKIKAALYSGMEITRQDLIAACWQVRMGAGDADGEAILESCKERWKNEDREICQIVIEQGGWPPIFRGNALAADVCNRDLTDYKDFSKEAAMTEESGSGPANDYLICRSTEADDYSIWRVDIDGHQPFTRVKTGTFDHTHQLIPIGNYILESGPITDQVENDPSSGVFPYRLFKFDASIEDPLAVDAKSVDPVSQKLSPTLVTTGTWTKKKFFWLVPDFGSPQGPGKEFMKGDKLLLLPLGTFILDLIPTAGRGTFKLFQFDPGSTDPIPPFPTTDPSGVVLGSFETIEVGHELIPLGNYVLDWVPKTREYWLWSFDPMNETPLARPAIQTGHWDDIDENHQLIPLGEDVLDWDMKERWYRLWRFDPKSDNPLTGPVRAGPMPEEFDAQMTRYGVKGNTLTCIQGLRPVDQVRKDTPGTIHFMRSKIKHVVVYMVENRSFDHACGWLYENDEQIINFIGHRGPFQGAKLDMSNLDRDQGARVPLNTDGPDVTTKPNVDLYHDMTDTMRQCFFENRNGYAERTRPDMGGFVWNNGNKLAMSTSKPEKLPVLNGLAKAFAVSDEWFCSMPGATDANRAFALTGSALGELNNFMSGPKYETWPELAHRASIWKVLWANGFTDWKIYNSMEWYNLILTYQLFLQGQIPTVDNDVSPYLKDETQPSKYIGSIDQFFEDALSGTLPAFSFLEPVWIEAGVSTKPAKPATSYHPLGKGGVTPAETRLNAIYDALKSGPKWNETLLIVTFDEHGGFFDHVPPPRAVNPWPHDVKDGFSYDLMGVRVPTILVSPWIKEHTVFRSSTPLDYDADSPAPVAYDSTSILATLLHWYGIPEARWALGRRVQQAPTFEGVFQCQSPRSDKPSFEVAQPSDALLRKEKSDSPERLSNLEREFLPAVIATIVGDKVSAKERRKITGDILGVENVDQMRALLTNLTNKMQ